MERRMMIAGGGTGGHLFPAMAVAEEFMARDPAHRVLFVGTERGIESRAVPGAGYEFSSIRSRGIAGKSLSSKAAGALTIPLSMLDAARLLSGFKPHAALGVGGYVSGPCLLAARLSGIPSAIQEQNTVPGFTNRILSLIADKVFISFEESGGRFGCAQREGRVVLAGNPLRKSIVDSLKGYDRQEDRNDRDRFSILVVGGSQGASGLNRLVLEAMSLLADEYRDKVRIRHQTGDSDHDLARAAYRELGVEARVLSFIDDMAEAYKQADMVISRAGAGAVAEIALAGLPSILMPYPFAASDHQAKNAQALVKPGAARMLRQEKASPRDLAEAIKDIADHPETRQSMARAARRAAMPGASAVVVDSMLELMDKKGRAS